MKKVLIINTVGYNYDGITTVILNYLKGMKKVGLSFTFPVYADIHPKLKEELEALGEVVLIANRKQNVKAFIAELWQLMKKGYDVIHIHGNSGTMLIETLLAKLRGVKKIIVHAHSTSTNYPFMNEVLKYPMMLLADVLLACSDAAGMWLYGNRSHIILNNAIDIEKFRFNPEMRDKYRSEFAVGEEYLIGHVGHFSPSKNHPFLIDVFEAFHEIEPASKLLLVGVGADFQQIQETVKDRRLGGAVIFAGSRSDISAIYSAMDLLVLPSRWEGLSLVTVEAQANGLPALVSDAVPQITNCTQRVCYKPLSDGVNDWASCVQKMKQITYDRMLDVHAAISDCGFDIQKEAEQLRKIYLD